MLGEVASGESMQDTDESQVNATVHAPESSTYEAGEHLRAHGHIRARCVAQAETQGSNLMACQARGALDHECQDRAPHAIPSGPTDASPRSSPPSGACPVGATSGSFGCNSRKFGSSGGPLNLEILVKFRCRSRILQDAEWDEGSRRGSRSGSRRRECRRVGIQRVREQDSTDVRRHRY
jgi:hypothetical protein